MITKSYVILIIDEAYNEYAHTGNRQALTTIIEYLRQSNPYIKSLFEDDLLKDVNPKDVPNIVQYLNSYGKLDYMITKLKALL